jgi:hypothetical protein
VQIKNNISFRNFTYGMKIFGETGGVKDCRFERNIVFDNPIRQIESSSGSNPTSNIWFVANIMLGSPMLYYVSPYNSHQYFYSNIVVSGAFQVGNHTNSVYTNNIVFMMKDVNPLALTTAESGYASTTFLKSELNVVYDYNTYYTWNESCSQAWKYKTLDVASTINYWKDWRLASGFDSHSTCATNWPTDYLNVSVQPNDYDSNRWHICVVNTTTATNAILNLSTLGFSDGHRYELRDAQNYFTVIARAPYTGGVISLPLNLTNAADIPGVTHFTNKHTNMDNPGLFNAFVLRRIPVLLPPSNPHVLVPQ